MTVEITKGRILALTNATALQGIGATKGRILVLTSSDELDFETDEEGLRFAGGDGDALTRSTSRRFFSSVT